MKMHARGRGRTAAAPSRLPGCRPESAGCCRRHPARRRNAGGMRTQHAWARLRRCGRQRRGSASRGWAWVRDRRARRRMAKRSQARCPSRGGRSLPGRPSSPARHRWKRSVRLVAPRPVAFVSGQLAQPARAPRSRAPTAAVGKVQFGLRDAVDRDGGLAIQRVEQHERLGALGHPPRAPLAARRCRARGLLITTRAVTPTPRRKKPATAPNGPGCGSRSDGRSTRRGAPSGKTTGTAAAATRLPSSHNMSVISSRRRSHCRREGWMVSGSRMRQTATHEGGTP